MLTSGVVLHHDIAIPHTAARTRALLEYLTWKLFDHPPYISDLALSDYHSKNWFRSQRCNNNEELTDGAKTRLSSRTADFFDTGIQKLIPRYDKCLNSDGDYVKK
jgi:hypothetical protein